MTRGRHSHALAMPTTFPPNSLGGEGRSLSRSGDAVRASPVRARVGIACACAIFGARRNAERGSRGRTHSRLHSEPVPLQRGCRPRRCLLTDSSLVLRRAHIPPGGVVLDRPLSLAQEVDWHHHSRQVQHGTLGARCCATPGTSSAAPWASACRLLRESWQRWAARPRLC